MGRDDDELLPGWYLPAIRVSGPPHLAHLTKATPLAFPANASSLRSPEGTPHRYGPNSCTPTRTVSVLQMPPNSLALICDLPGSARFGLVYRTDAAISPGGQTKNTIAHSETIHDSSCSI